MSTSDQAVSRLEDPIPGSYEERLKEARRLRNRGEYQAALEILDRITRRLLRLPERRRQPNSDLWVDLIAATALTADIKSEIGDITESDALWKQLEAWDTASWTSWRRARLVRQVARGEVEEGLRELQTLAEEVPDDIDNWLAVAQTALRADELDSAETALQQVEPLLDETDSTDYETRFFLLRYGLNVRRERWREALNDWYDARDSDEDLEEHIESVERILLAAGQYDLALELLEDEGFAPPLALYYRAWIAQRRGDTLRARRLWRQLLDLPANLAADFAPLVAGTLCWLGRPQEAVAVLLREVDLAGRMRAVDALALALAWGMMGRVVEARADLATALNLAEPDQPLTALEWYEFDTLITDEDVKTALREFFALDSEQSSAADTP